MANINKIQVGSTTYDIEDTVARSQSAWLNTGVKAALLACFEHVAWIDENGQTYYDALYNALYPPTNLVSISAVYTQSGTVYNNTSLNSLKSDLVVTAHYSDLSTETITNYSLNGTLTVGTSTITVSYGGKTTTFDVLVTEYVRYSWSLSNGDVHIQAGSLSWDATHDLTTNTRTTSVTSRRNIYTDDGVKPYNTTPDDVNYSVTNPPQYPIPVPSDATSCTYTITPSSQFAGAAFYTYDSNTDKYTRTDDIGWKQGSYTFTFTAGSKHYMTIATKYNSSGTTYPTEPTEITIDFE